MPNPNGRRRPPPVLTKSDFYRRFYQGEFGNHSPMWDSLAAWERSDFQGEVAIRTKIPGGRCDYFVPRDQVPSRWREFEAEGWRQMNISAQCPEQDKVLQGEFQLTPSGLYLRWACEYDLPMREALRDHDHHCFGFEAHSRLKEAMCPNSWRWSQYLLEAYPDHVVEFTSLRYCWGAVPGFNTLFWEVRAY